MSLHGLLSVTIGVPNVDETAAYYTDFGLTPGEGGWFSTADAGQQLRLLPAPVRRLLELRVGADDPDDLARAAADMDCISDDQLWTPEELEGRGGCSPGARRRPPPSCIPRTSRP